jgi:hypothetical protein
MNNSNCLTHLAIGTAFLLATGSVFASETSLSDNLITTSKAAINQQSKKYRVSYRTRWAFGRS